MSVSVSNTNLTDSFNTWRLNTNFAATVISNNVVTVARAGNSNRGGLSTGNGHINGTFSANELRTNVLKGGNTSSVTGGTLDVQSNTIFTGYNITVSANAVFTGNVNFTTTGTDRLVLGDISRIRMSGGTSGDFLRKTGSDTMQFSTPTLRTLQDLSTNSAHIILSSANTSFSQELDSPHLIFSGGAGQADRFKIFIDGNTSVGDSDLLIQMVANDGGSAVRYKDSTNTTVTTITDQGRITAANRITSAGITSSQAILPSSDDAVDLGSTSAEFRNAYIDGIAYIDQLSMGTIAGQGVATNFVPLNDSSLNLGTQARKWLNLFTDYVKAEEGRFGTHLGISGTFVANGAIDLGNATSDSLTITAEVDSNIMPKVDDGVGHYDLGSTARRWNEVYANTVYANNIITDTDLTVTGDLIVEGATTIQSGQVFSADDAVMATIAVTGLSDLRGNVDIGNQSSDTVTINAKVDSNIIPYAGTENIGSPSSQWNNAYFDGTVQTDILIVDETMTVADNATFSGDRIAVSGNAVISDSIILTNAIYDGDASTVFIGKNGNLHANNTIATGTILKNMIANTMNLQSTVNTAGSSTKTAVFRVNDRGQIISISNTDIDLVTNIDYTQSNNVITVTTTDGNTYKAFVDFATANTDGSNGGITNRGLASFDSDFFTVTDGMASIANTTSSVIHAIQGTEDEINISRTNGVVTVGLPEDVTITGQLNVSENVIVAGNLQVSGTTHFVNSTTVEIGDNIIELNADVTGAPTEDAGIVIERGDETNVTFKFNETTDRWSFTNDGSTFYNIPISTEYDLYTSWTINDGNANTGTYTITSGDTLQITQGNGIDSTFGADDLLTITNIKPYDQLNFVDGDGTSITMSNDQHMKFVEGTGIDINFTDTSDGTSADPYDLTITNTDRGSQQNIFKNIAVQNSGVAVNTIQTDQNNDTVTLNFSTGITPTVDTSTDTITVSVSEPDTFLAGTGLSSSGGGLTFNVDSDQRGIITQFGLDTNHYMSIDTDSMDFFLDGVLDMQLQNDGDLHVDGDMIAFSTTTSSDEKLKENITVVENALEKVKQIRGVEFDWKKNGEKSAGVIAQDIEKVLPQAVKEVTDLKTDEPYKTVKYDALHALLFEAVKELSERVEKLERGE